MERMTSAVARVSCMIIVLGPIVVAMLCIIRLFAGSVIRAHVEAQDGVRVDFVGEDIARGDMGIVEQEERRVVPRVGDVVASMYRFAPMDDDRRESPGASAKPEGFVRDDTRAALAEVGMALDGDDERAGDDVVLEAPTTSPCRRPAVFAMPVVDLLPSRAAPKADGDGRERRVGVDLQGDVRVHLVHDGGGRIRPIASAVVLGVDVLARVDMQCLRHAWILRQAHEGFMDGLLLTPSHVWPPCHDRAPVPETGCGTATAESVRFTQRGEYLVLTSIGCSDQGWAGEEALDEGR
jgi:hypothetical protein